MAEVRATVQVSIGDVPVFNGVIDPQCLTVEKISPIEGFLGLVADVPRSRVTITHVEACRCGDRSQALVLNIPTKDLTVDVAREGRAVTPTDARRAAFDNASRFRNNATGTTYRRLPGTDLWSAENDPAIAGCITTDQAVTLVEMNPLLGEDG